MIGHEISHGFDDQGRKSDGDGVLRDWWTAEDAAKFKAQADRLGSPVRRVRAPARRQGQGRPDHGREHRRHGRPGLRRLQAYHASLGGKPAPVLDGFTGDQRVYPGLGPGVARQDARRRRCASRWSATPLAGLLPRQRHDPEPGRLVHGLGNVKPGDKLYVAPEDRVDIW